MPAETRATRSGFHRRQQPISAPQQMPLLPRRVWSDEEWDRIQLGYTAWGMDEKWNVFAEGDTVFVHRSWTGKGIFEAAFVPVDGRGWRIAEAVVEGDPQRYRSMGEAYDRVTLELVISSIVLGEAARELRWEMGELSRQSSGRASPSAGAAQHSALGLRTDS